MQKFVLVLSVVLVFSCRSSREVPSVQGNWTLTSLNAPGADFKALYPSNAPTLKIELGDNRATGKNGCNNYSGTLKIVGNQIVFDKNMVTTRMFCPGDGERLYMGALQKANAYTVTKDALNLLSSDTVLLTFARK
ncbi:MAG: META domain-containing protein [Proteobacteria bacterium]|nr:MAG: META domain-containing protein [Pseudomonadota bacterium]